MLRACLLVVGLMGRANFSTQDGPAAFFRPTAPPASFSARRAGGMVVGPALSAPLPLLLRCL